MINKSKIKEKSEELNIPFGNLLSGVVCETIIEMLISGEYANELYLNNGMEFNIENYQKTTVGTIYYEFSRDIDEKMAVLYLRDIKKDIISRGVLEDFKIEGKVENNLIHLSIIVDDMYVPVDIRFEKRKQTAAEGEMQELAMTMYSNRVIKYLTNPKEELLVNHLVEIIEKLELINDMDHYYESYDILSKYPINGRKVKDRLAERLQDIGVETTEKRFELLKSYGDYTYMKKKWKVELRQKKTSSPEWKDVNDCIIKFLSPIWDTINSKMIFLGDWMPQIKRFLD